MTESLSETCGQLIVGGYLGQEPSRTLLSAIRRRHRAGAILFKRNLPDWTAGLAAGRLLVEAGGAGPSPIVAVDQEGGRVQRFREPFLQVPTMRRLGAANDEVVAEAATNVGQQLHALGFNINFAPVLDVDTNPDNPVIGDRSFSRDPWIVARLGSIWSRGLQSAGIAACGKHFPGHGDTSLDSHLSLPSVDTPLERLGRVEFVPFRAAIDAGVDAMMSAHIVVRAIDASQPATLCYDIITGMLRDELHFNGVVFSDDLEMGAIAGRYEVGGAAVRAIRAGCDIVLICRSEAFHEEAHAAMIREAEHDAAFRARCEQAAERSRVLRWKRPAKPVGTNAQVEVLFNRARGLQERLSAI